jgi:hypothetical protein
LRHVPLLEELDICNSNKIALSALSHLTHVPRLWRFHFSSVIPVPWQDISSLPVMSALQCLHIYVANVTDADLELLSWRLTSLRELILDSCRRITDAGLAYVSNIASLRTLYLCDMDRLDGSGLAHFAGAAAQLCSLRFEGCRNLQLAALEHLHGMPSLSELHVESCPVSAAQLIASVRPIPHLATCQVDEEDITSRWRRAWGAGV